MGPYEEFHLVPYGRTYLERDPLPKTVVQTSVQKVKFSPQHSREVCWCSQAGTGCWPAESKFLDQR